MHCRTYFLEYNYRNTLLVQNWEWKIVRLPINCQVCQCWPTALVYPPVKQGQSLYKVFPVCVGQHLWQLLQLTFTLEWTTVMYPLQEKQHKYTDITMPFAHCQRNKHSGNTGSFPTSPYQNTNTQELQQSYTESPFQQRNKTTYCKPKLWISHAYNTLEILSLKCS